MLTPEYERELARGLANDMAIAGIVATDFQDAELYFGSDRAFREMGEDQHNAALARILRMARKAQVTITLEGDPT